MVMYEVMNGLNLRMYFLKVRLHSIISCSCSHPLPLVQHVLGHCKQLTRAKKSTWFISCRHLACVHFRACRFWQVILKFKHGFWDSSIYKSWKDRCGCSEPSVSFQLFFSLLLLLSLVNKSLWFFLQKFSCILFSYE